MSRLKLTFRGNVILRQDYADNETKYYAVLNGTIIPDAVIGQARVENLAVPIVKERYDELKRELEDSSSQHPFLRFNGELEVNVESFANKN